MFSITPSELLTIGIVALIIFGPRRLPELARKAGRIITELRTAADDFKEEVRQDLESTTEPFREATTDLAAAGHSLRETVDGELVWVDDKLKETTKGPSTKDPDEAPETPQAEAEEE